MKHSRVDEVLMHDTHRRISGDVAYVPITSTSPASNYWGIDQDLTYGTSTTLLSGSAGIVDTGTTLLLLATDAFQAYQDATGATLDNETGLLTISESQLSNLQSLFNVGGTEYEFTANAQIWPRALNSTIGGQDGKIYLITADLGSESGQGLDFISTSPCSHVCSIGLLLIMARLYRRLCIPPTVLQRLRHGQQPARPRPDPLHHRGDQLEDRPARSRIPLVPTGWRTHNH